MLMKILNLLEFIIHQENLLPVVIANKSLTWSTIIDSIYVLKTRRLISDWTSPMNMF
jgi:hypothetical protein